MTPLADTLSLSEFATAVGIHRNTASRWLNDGAVEGARRVGREWEIPVSTAQQMKRAIDDSLTAHQREMDAAELHLIRSIANIGAAADELHAAVTAAAQAAPQSEEFFGALPQVSAALQRVEIASVIRSDARRHCVEVLQRAGRTIEDVEGAPDEVAQRAGRLLEELRRAPVVGSAITKATQDQSPQRARRAAAANQDAVGDEEHEG